MTEKEIDAMVYNKHLDIIKGVVAPAIMTENYLQAYKEGIKDTIQQLMKDSVLCGGDGWFINNKRTCRQKGRFHKYYVSTISHDKPLPMDNGKNYKLIVIEDEDR